MTSECAFHGDMLLTNRDILSFAGRLCESKGFDAKTDYPQRVDSEVMKSAARRMMYMRLAMALLRRAIFLGAIEGEVLRIAEYLMVLNYSTDCHLDYRKAQNDLRIDELEKKYSRSEFLATDYEPEDLDAVIERDRTFYGVPLKEDIPEAEENVTERIMEEVI